ncbi:hypothetical protein QBC40DRAFT_352038 [Triangularia verruculosa]|uniref:Uncharacterized protein n=1 Tax=Triangularia verruculosa TaxID=2587418 RepID=A0AAN6X923_9PEZI|nr:hypothetical protein QBC40DRAFT_352038 [Triangularia verruculosa]
MEFEAQLRRRTWLPPGATERQQYIKYIELILDDKRPPESLPDALHDLQFIKLQLQVLVNYVHQQGLSDDASPTVRTIVMSIYGPKALSNSIEARIVATAEQTVSDSCATNDDLDRAMGKFVDPIRDLSNMDHEDSVKEAIRLVGLVRWCLTYMSMEYTNRHERHDKEFDSLLSELFYKRARRDHLQSWIGERYHRALTREANAIREGLGIDDWFAQTRNTLERLMGFDPKMDMDSD